MDHALEYQKPNMAALVPIPDADITNLCAVQLRTLWSGLSRGTERLVFEGRVPESEFDRMRAPHQRGAFPFPVVYGYSLVGLVEEGPQDLVGKTVFALHPHQSRCILPAADVTPLPASLPPRRATLAANMETALNALWDGGVGPGDRVAIIGAGILGGLLAGLCSAIPGVEITLIDVQKSRRSLADHMNVSFVTPDFAPSGCDVVFHTSSNASGLATAIDCAGFEATIIEMSWYGEGRIAVPLGGAFHSQRLRLICSQVGQVAPSRRARWPYARRLAKALDLLCDDRFDALITEETPFETLPETLPRLLAPGADGLATAIRYGG